MPKKIDPEVKKAKQEIKAIKKTSDYKERLKAEGDHIAATIWANNKLKQGN
jgi:hypothetical protein